MTDEKANKITTVEVVQIGDWSNLSECPICKSEKIVQFCANIQEYRPTTRWSICEICSHVFVNPQPSDLWTKNFYKEGYRKMTHRLKKEDPKAIPRGSAEEEMSRAMHVVNNIIRFRGEAPLSNHLDIGSSTGALLASTMSKFSCKLLVGVEPGDAWREFSVNSYEDLSKNLARVDGIGPMEDAEKSKLVVYPSLSKVPKATKFDLITIIHTLEHVLQPLEMVRDAGLRLRAKGLLMIMVPYLFGGFADPLMFPHLHSFTQDSLKNLIERAGLEVLFLENGGGVNAPLWPPPVDLFVIAAKPGVAEKMDKTRLLELYMNARLVDRKVKDITRTLRPRYEMG